MKNVKGFNKGQKKASNLSEMLFFSKKEKRENAFFNTSQNTSEDINHSPKSSPIQKYSNKGQNLIQRNLSLEFPSLSDFLAEAIENLGSDILEGLDRIPEVGPSPIEYIESFYHEQKKELRNNDAGNQLPVSGKITEMVQELRAELAKFIRIDNEKQPVTNNDCGIYEANKSWLPDAYVQNATCACQETPNEPHANTIREVLQRRLVQTPDQVKEKAKEMKSKYESGEISIIEYNEFVILNLTPRIYFDHVIAYREAGCPGGPAPYSAWIGVTTVPIPVCELVWLSILLGGGSCSGEIGEWI